ncbi:transmembrane and death domain protein 1-like [Rhinichthys klamathensis goyatoka]|uniref:transmembrane and death domain protein 1-like n=1 Tax=Rhinichthys klamathensis goyatoka TaxID=3034132 RepID=UPI0024B48CC4|nr:transmembrane and death domain protein 1-like [Rhinichthys klamathensis goyatoka]
MRGSVLGFFLLLFFSPSLADDTVAEDIGPHQLERLVELLTDRECEEFISAMTQPEDNIFQHLDRLSAERNQLLQSRRRRHTGDQKPPCRSALKDWLQIHGKQIYYDRLSRALQQIGRTDIAIEVGKNINQDKTLAIQRYVEGYHELVSQREKNQAENHDDHEEVLQYSAKQARGLTWKDLDLVVKRHPVPPYQHHLLDRTWPLLYGLLSGFSIALLMSMAIFLISIYVSHGNRTKSRSEHQPCCCPLLSVVTSSEVRRPEDTLRPSNGCSG